MAQAAAVLQRILVLWICGWLRMPRQLTVPPVTWKREDISSATSS